MSDKKPGISAALDQLGGPGAPPSGDAEQLALLPDMRSKDVGGGEEPGGSGAGAGPAAPPAPAVRAAGRPKGARNKRTTEIADYLSGKYGFPLERLAQVYSSKPDTLQKELKINRLEAVKLIKDAAIACLPYMHQKQPVAVDVTQSKTISLVIGDITGAEGEVEAAAHEGISIILEKDETGVYSEKSENKSKA